MIQNILAEHQKEVTTGIWIENDQLFQVQFITTLINWLLIMLHLNFQIDFLKFLILKLFHLEVKFFNIFLNHSFLTISLFIWIK